MKHLDEIPLEAFKEISSGAAEALVDMVGFIKEKNMCPVCFCHLMAEVARDLGRALEKRDPHHAKTH